MPWASFRVVAVGAAQGPASGGRGGSVPRNLGNGRPPISCSMS
jgi:hypothetical protein